MTTRSAQLDAATSSGVWSPQPTQLMSAPRSTRYWAAVIWAPLQALHKAWVISSNATQRSVGASPD